MPTRPFEANGRALAHPVGRPWSRQREAIPESIELLGVQAEHRKPHLKQPFHDRSPWSLDRHRDPLRVSSRLLLEPLDHFRYAVTAVSEASLLVVRRPFSYDTHLKLRLAQINADVDETRILRPHGRLHTPRASGTRSPLYWRFARNWPAGPLPEAFLSGRCPRWRSERRYGVALPRGGYI